MKKQWKMVLGFLVACLTVCSASGCNSQNKREYYFSDYDNGQELYLGVFSSPLPNLESYQECADAGFNYILMDEDNGNVRGSALQETTLGYCYQTGLTAMVMAFNFHNVYDDTVDNTDYNKFPAYGGSFFFDEPYMNSFDYIANAIPSFEKKYPDKNFMVNLHPATPFINNLEECNYNGKQYTYEEYLSEYKSKVLDKLSGEKMLSVDIYPLLDGKGRDNTILKQYLYTLEATAKIARGTDIFTHYYIMTHGHGNCRAPLSVGDISFQYYTAMAYGVKGFSSFAYKQQKGGDFAGFDGLINWEDNGDGTFTTRKTPIYDYVKQANGNIRAFENVYLSFDWLKTMAITGNEVAGENYCYAMLKENAEKLDGLKSVTATQDSLIGYFEDAKNNTKGYMVTNFSEPSKGLNDKVTLTFENSKKVRIYQNGETEEKEIIDGTLSLNLSAGDGAFILAI